MTSNPTLIKKILDEQILWHRRAQQGCAFASYLAHPDRIDNGLWRREVLFDFTNEKAIKKFYDLVEETVSLDTCQVLSVIMPEIKTQDDLSIFLFLLHKFYPGINIDYEFHPDKDYTCVKIRVPIGDEKFAWLLGFISIDVTPATRKSPYTELVIATKSKQYLKEKYNRYSLNKHNEDTVYPRTEDEKSVHLADIHIEGITSVTKEDTKIWGSTKNLKKAKLEGKIEDVRSKGKVSFTVPGNFNPLRKSSTDS